MSPLLCALLCCASALAHAEAPQPLDQTQDDAQVRAHVQRILQRHEFRELDPRHEQVFRLWDWLLELLRRHDEPERDVMSTPRFQMRLPASLVVMLALVLLLAVLAFVSKEVRRALPSATPRELRTGPSLVPPPRSLDEQLSEATRLAQTGAYAEALRALHGAALVLTARSTGQRLDGSRTDGQYLRSLEPGPVREGFTRIAARFERAYYGGLPVVRDDYDAARAALETLLRAAAPRSLPPERA